MVYNMLELDTTIKINVPTEPGDTSTECSPVSGSSDRAVYHSADTLTPAHNLQQPPPLHPVRCTPSNTFNTHHSRRQMKVMIK